MTDVFGCDFELVLQGPFSHDIDLSMQNAIFFFICSWYRGYPCFQAEPTTKVFVT